MTTKNIANIDKQCESLKNQIAKLSGNYLTNTPKRVTEQKRRDKKKEQLRQRLELLTYFKSEAGYRDLSAFETALLTGTFYDEIKTRFNQYQYYNEHPSHSVTPVQFTKINEQHQKTLIKIGISDTDELLNSLALFGNLLLQAVTQTDPDAARLRDLVYKARLSQSGDVQFTPEQVAERMVALAEIKPGDKVLEPEAGIASIADKAKEITADVDCIELCSDFREILELKGHNIVACDLFEYEQRPIYDAILMNPPFSNEIEHINYAFGFLKPGGTLVAICTKRFDYIPNKGYPAFKDWLEQHNLYYENISDKFEMTGMNPVILKIKKGATEQAAQSILPLAKTS